MATPKKWGSEFFLNDFTNGIQGRPSIANLDGKFVAVWQDSTGTLGDNNPGIHGRVFDAHGDKNGLEFLVNTQTQPVQSDPSVAVLADGRFVVTWSSTGDIHGQVFEVDGTKSGGEFALNASANVLSDV